MKSDKVDKIENPKGEELAKVDCETSEAKLKILSDKGFDEKALYDLKCGVCGRHCCSPCTADGDPAHCAQTKFKNCSKCGCLSSEHYAVRH